MLLGQGNQNCIFIAPVGKVGISLLIKEKCLLFHSYFHLYKIAFLGDTAVK